MATLDAELRDIHRRLEALEQLLKDQEVLHGGWNPQKEHTLESPPPSPYKREYDQNAPTAPETGTCAARFTLDGATTACTCSLAMGHPVGHKHKGDGFIIYWER